MKQFAGILGCAPRSATDTLSAHATASFLLKFWERRTRQCCYGHIDAPESRRGTQPYARIRLLPVSLPFSPLTAIHANKAVVEILREASPHFARACAASSRGRKLVTADTTVADSHARDTRSTIQEGHRSGNLEQMLLGPFRAAHFRLSTGDHVAACAFLEPLRAARIHAYGPPRLAKFLMGTPLPPRAGCICAKGWTGRRVASPRGIHVVALHAAPRRYTLPAYRGYLQTFRETRIKTYCLNDPNGVIPPVPTEEPPIRKKLSLALVGKTANVQGYSV